MARSIAIIGGAGPMAGTLFLQKIIKRCQEVYHCKNDADFPLMCLLSYPFSQMLDESNYHKVFTELKQVLKQVDQQGFNLVSIACNTLHGFLDKESSYGFHFVDLVHETNEWIRQHVTTKILILCTTTSFEKQVHSKIENRFYLDRDGRKTLDAIIDRVLEGKAGVAESRQIGTLIESTVRSQVIKGKTVSVLLGCTELSLEQIDRF